MPESEEEGDLVERLQVAWSGADRQTTREAADRIEELERRALIAEKALRQIADGIRADHPGSPCDAIQKLARAALEADK